MSPAPQGNLEVERYIGTYLISQRIPPNVKSSTGNKRYQNHHAKQKHPDTEKVRNFNKYCFPQRDHHVGGPPRYSMPPGQLPLPVDCQGYGNNHYGKHNAGGSGWAGVPLISMTSGNHRRNKKAPSTTNPNQIQKYPVKQDQQNSYIKKDSDEHLLNDTDRSPLTRLAIHTQGAPLIQAGRYSNNNRCRNNFSRDISRSYRGEAVRWDSAKDSKATVGIPNKDQACGNTDSLSVASDESSGNSENSLPRIIKPRKRRKKDRKPITGTPPVTSTPNDVPHYSRESDQIVESSTLKTFLPLCFEHNATKSNENHTTDLLTENNHSTSVDEKQNEDLIDPLTSADEFPFGNLLDDEDDNRSELSSCAPATLCQCRYCDPSGVIWDVDQRCYSPFLTPPSPTDGNLHFSNSLPIQFDSFSHITRSYNRQAAVVESPASPHSHYGFTGDLGSLLRRSWSDPSSYKLRENFQVPNSECGREKPGSRPSSPLGLQVSSEIVTSPNGHRDIEIKFYSSSTPPEFSKSKNSASDRDLNDRCFVVEE